MIMQLPLGTRLGLVVGLVRICKSPANTRSTYHVARVACLVDGFCGVCSRGERVCAGTPSEIF
jgi:hypothetical protein